MLFPTLGSKLLMLCIYTKHYIQSIPRYRAASMVLHIDHRDVIDIGYCRSFVLFGLILRLNRHGSFDGAYCVITER